MKNLSFKHLFYVVWLLLPLSFYAHYQHWDPVWQMVISSLGILPLAKLMGEATEHLAHKTGDTIGGLINATFGNACELIIAIIALKAGMLDVVKASITGSIIGNSLLVMGASMLVGGLKHKEQRFNLLGASAATPMLMIMAFSLITPAALHHIGGPSAQAVSVQLALGISAVLIILYILGLVFQLRTHAHLLGPVGGEVAPTHVVANEAEATSDSKVWSVWKSLIVLSVTTIFVVFLVEHLIGSVEHAAKAIGMTPVFIGVILLAIVGNAAEHSTAIIMAYKNKMDLSLNIVLSSSNQIALFVAPVVVFIGYFIGQPMDLVFTQAEIIAVLASVMLLNALLQDGKTNWLEGTYLLGLYIILGMCFYFVH